MQSRRQFTKDLLKGACVVACAGVIGVMPSCTTIKTYQGQLSEKTISIPLTAFEKDKMRIVQIKGMANDILVIKKGNDEFTALLMRCTHRDFELTVNPKGLNCASHGSAFDLDGKVTNGPAETPLKKFRTSINNNDLIIHLT